MADGPAPVERALVREARAFADVGAALLVRVDEAARRIDVAAGDPEPLPRAPAPLASVAAVADALTAELPVRLEGEQARRSATALGVPGQPETLLLVPARPPASELAYVLVLGGDAPGGFGGDEIRAAAAFASAASASLGQLALLDRGSRQLARQSALARAAKALNESLDLARVLPRICQEAAAILGADAVAVYRGVAGKGLVLEATHPDNNGVGTRLDPGAGLVGRVLALGRPLRAESYETPPRDVPLAGARSALAAPMRWDGEGRGALWVGYLRDHAPSDEDLDLLASFAELAAVACRNASVQAGLAEAARTDGLTGCLNHAALHETLRREMQRSRRTGRRLSAVLVDLDHFKQVNETQGHLVGDDVLRRVGRALREAVRPYDFVARYGGDEFAIVAVDASEELAAEIGERAIERVGGALDEVLGAGSGPHATAGVAEWQHGGAPSDLVRAADRALLYGKQEGVRGTAIRGTAVPEGFMLGRTLEEDRPPVSAPEGDWPSAARRETEPLRKRARQLSLATAVGARLAQLTRVDEIAATAAGELERAFGYARCQVVARAEAEDGLVARTIAERRTVLDGTEAAVPISAGAELWGALYAQAPAGEPFEGADARLLETVADQLGAALRSATLYERLERAYLSTAEALGAALESRDAGTAAHARTIVVNAERVGRRLGMSEDELRDLRYAAAFHDIGKVVVPDAILRKPGPLTDHERQEIERGPVVAEQILEPVDFLDRVREMVRHCHERWDGNGYPDGLAGERIPLGARVIQVCEAHEAMTSDRPYRTAMDEDRARDELLAAAGAEFDREVAEAFLDGA